MALQYTKYFEEWKLQWFDKKNLTYLNNSLREVEERREELQYPMESEKEDTEYTVEGVEMLLEGVNETEDGMTFELQYETEEIVQYILKEEVIKYQELLQEHLDESKKDKE